MSRPLADESVFRAVAHATRRRLLEMLRERDRPVAELVAAIRLSRPAMSQHLRILRTSGLVKQRRSGRNRLYALDRAQLRRMRQWIVAFDAPAN